MAIRVIKVPDVGEGIAEVELVVWHVAVGTTVREDQALAEVVTDKASVEIPSPVSGRVVALGGDVGRMLAVGSELIRIEVDASDGAPAAADGPAASAVPAVPASPQASAAPPAPAAPSAPARAPVSPLPAAPVASTRAAQVETCSADRPIASPAVRRRAWELGIDLGSVPASGPGGRILQADLDAAASRGKAGAAPTPAAAARRRLDREEVPVIGVRRRIALQMQEAKRRIPHFSYVEEIDVTDLEVLRAVLNQRHAAARGHLTLLPLLMRAMVLALRTHPQINARFDDQAGIVTRFGAVHLGVATQSRYGLLVPVVRHAEALDLWATAAEVARLAEAARAGRATRDELSGSTITLSSLGALGGIASTPVINRPEVAIVAVNRIVERPVVRRGAVVVRQTMNLSSSFDHRVVDGADGAAFIQAVRSLLEQPALMFVEPEEAAGP